MQIICTKYQQQILLDALSGGGLTCSGFCCPAESLGCDDLPDVCRMSCEECLKDRLNWRIEE